MLERFRPFLREVRCAIVTEAHFGWQEVCGVADLTLEEHF